MTAAIISSCACFLLVWITTILTNEHIDERFDALERRLFKGKTIQEEEDDNE